MIVRGLLFALVLLTVLLVQTVAGSSLAIGGVAPDLVTLSVLVLAVLDGPGLGLRYGFAAGLAVDLLSGGESVVGISALVLLIAGYLAGLARPYLAANQFAGTVLVAAVGTAAVVAGRQLLEFLLGLDPGDAFGVALDALATGIYGALLSPIAAFLLRRLVRLVPGPGTPTA